MWLNKFLFNIFVRLETLRFLLRNFLIYKSVQFLTAKSFYSRCKNKSKQIEHGKYYF